MKLRNYQIELINKIYSEWKNNQNILMQLSTGGGKTVVFSNIIKEHKGYCIAIAHRVEIVSQISLTLAKHGIRHNIIAQKSAVREIVSIHLQEIGKSFYQQNAICFVSSVDTLLRLPKNTDWFSKITLVIQDEGHHTLKTNKWGSAASLFPNAKGLYPTATPCRADGKNLSRKHEGIMDTIITGISMRKLIEQGFLTDYRIFAPPSSIDLTQIPIGTTGDYSQKKLSIAVHKAHITGDIVKQYLRIAKGKQGVTFATDINAAIEIAEAFNNANVPAETISSKTPDSLRYDIMRRFRNKELFQLVNVDILGEGVDVPAIEVVSMARPTQSYCLYSQQFGRALRPDHNKTHAIIIDHVENCLRHGLPDAVRLWSLEKEENRIRSKRPGVIPLRNCLNSECFAVYESYKKCCPYCGYTPSSKGRSTIAQVEGDLLELDQEILKIMRGESLRLLDAPIIHLGLSPIAQRELVKKHNLRREAQQRLRLLISNWAAYYHNTGNSDSEIYRRFYYTFDIDVMSAQLLSTSESKYLLKKIEIAIDEIINSK